MAYQLEEDNGFGKGRAHRNLSKTDVVFLLGIERPQLQEDIYLSMTGRNYVNLIPTFGDSSHLSEKVDKPS
jgi:hypothetical protein